MAASATLSTNITTGGGTNALGIMFDRKVINSLQPNLVFEQLGDIVMVEEGNNTFRYVMFDQISTGSVVTLTEGTIGTGAGSAGAIAVTNTVNSVVPVQYGISVQVSDLVVITAFIDLMRNTAIEVGYAMARAIDSNIQTATGGVQAGGSVYYGGGKASRAALAAGDLIDAFIIAKAVQKLYKNAAPTWSDGMFRLATSPDVIYDLKNNSSVAQWIDVAKYAQPEKLLNGEVGSLHGTRLMQSPNVQTFSSTVTVTPTYLFGTGAFRLAYWLPGRVRTYLLPPETTLSVNNPTGMVGSVGAKCNLGVSTTQAGRMVRVETAATSL